MEGGSLYTEILPFTLMIILEVANVGINTLFKAATSKGISFYVFTLYSSLISSLLLLPFSYFFHRRSLLPPLTTRIIGKTFYLGVLGALVVLLGYKGIEYSSPTLASAMSNIIPSFTFILAIVFRMEKLAWRSSTSQAKIIGTLISISGALVIILYKGPSIMFGPSKPTFNYFKFLQSSNSEWIMGGMFLGASYILYPVWFILQAHILKDYPSELTVIFLYSIFTTLVLVAISAVAVPDSAAWMLRLDISMVAILISGTYTSMCGAAETWIVRTKGPFYVTMFKPLSIAIAAAMGIICLGDTLYVGCLIGGTVISLGFYSLMWGKTREKGYEDLGYADPASSSSTICEAPLLQNSHC